MSPASLDALPQEISNNITSRLSKYDLLNLRCVSRALSLKAAPEAFHTIHRLAYGSSSQRFMQLAESKFSGLVQEVTCDSWNRPDYRYDGFVFCPDFWDALPFLGLFRNMNTLHIRLQPAGGHFEDGRTSRYKFGMLQVIFCSLAGAWSKKSQKWLDDYALGYWDKVDGYERNRWPDTLPTSPVPLSTLTILNLDSRRTSDFSGVGWVGTILAGLEDLRIGATRDLILGQTGDSLGLEKLYLDSCLVLLHPRDFLGSRHGGHWTSYHSLRWHHILSRLGDSITTLKTLEIGAGMGPSMMVSCRCWRSGGWGPGRRVK